MRSLLDPGSVMKNGAYTPSSEWPVWDPWMIGRASRSGVTDLGKGVDNFATSGEERSAMVGGDKSAEGPDPPPHVPEPNRFVPQPVSGLTFKDRLLSLARGLDSRNVEDRRGPDPRATMTIDEWIDNHSEWRKAR